MEELKEIGLNVGHCRAGRLMRQNGISVLCTRKHKVTTNSNHNFNIAPNLRDRDFMADLPNQKGVVTSPIFGLARAAFIIWTGDCNRVLTTAKNA